MLPAPNPWRRDPEERLTGSVEGGKILEGLTRIIDRWPRGKTVSKNDEDRHLRFILAIAGYPEIDVSTRPFDWPIHEHSLDALEVSRMLDDVKGATEATSLRSSLLNRDLNWRWQGKEKKKLRDMHKQCLELLFRQLRELDGEFLDDGYRWQEEAFLGALHSYDNNRIQAWWPNMDLLNDDLGQFDIQKNEHVELEFQFHQIQIWLEKMVPVDSEFLGTKQRWLRGASLLLEAVNSEVRQRIASLTGIGSIIIDGGGRVTWLCPPSLKKNAIDQIRLSLHQFLHLNYSMAGNSIRFESTLDNWSRRNMESGNNNPEVSSDDRGRRGPLEAVDKDYEFWFKQIAGLMPPYSLKEKTMSNSEENLIERIGSYPQPIIRVENECGECWFCGTADFFEGCEDEDKTVEKKNRSKRARKIDSYIGMRESSSSKSSESKICPLHRLLYLLGHDQRLKDSSIKLPKGEGSSQMRYPNSIIIDGDRSGKISRSRKVLAIANLDANSVGILFRERCQTELSEDEFLDRKRRRSFRFNATWWQVFGSSLDDFSSGDRVAAWVAAGDDVILAEYGQIENSQGGVITYPDTIIEDVLASLAKNLDEEFNEFEDGLFLSFSAGLAISAGQRIGDLLEESSGREKSAKNRWKTAMEGHEMLKMENGLKVPERNEEPYESDWIPETRSIVVKEGTVDHDSRKTEEEEFSAAFDEWNDEIIQKVKEHYSSHLGENPNEDDVFGVLKRHYIEDRCGTKTLHVLVPKMNSKS